MATVGHPLSDLSNLTNPYILAANPKVPRSHPAFIPGATPGLPTEEQTIQWYATVAGWDPAAEKRWGDAFGMFRSYIIMQGIAARYARRQASSANAKDYADLMAPFGDLAWALVEKVKNSSMAKSKL
jgi:aminoglycoside phosphotransferase (APT) family kinase protein